MLIINGKIVTWELPNRILDGRAVYIQGDQIIEVGNQADLLNRYPNEERVDAAGQLVMPGIICAHTHFYGAFGRGMAISGPAPKSFPEVLEKLWWKLDRALTFEDVEYSTLVCLIDAIKHGTTTLVDHHASPNAISGSLDVISDAIDRSGLRGCLCYEVTDRDGSEKALQGME
ncbi:MAG TPA: amidohydrolase family protein [Anaerolineaceae bacterium]|nr:amidohydrolase family protein [Anaerolineaceae bacterium]